MPTATGVRQQGEFVVTATGIEGSLVYALRRALRDAIARARQRHVASTCCRTATGAAVRAEWRGRAARARLSTTCKSRLGIEGVKAALLHELLRASSCDDPPQLAAALKALPLRSCAPRPIAEAISSAGGVAWRRWTTHLMLRALPGVFCAGEMLDWEAPTGGYLLTACFASGRMAGLGVLDKLSLARA